MSEKQSLTTSEDLLESWRKLNDPTQVPGAAITHISGTVTIPPANVSYPVTGRTVSLPPIPRRMTHVIEKVTTRDFPFYYDVKVKGTNDEVTIEEFHNDMSNLKFTRENLLSISNYYGIDFIPSRDVIEYFRGAKDFIAPLIFAECDKKGFISGLINKNQYTRIAVPASYSVPTNRITGEMLTEAFTDVFLLEPRTFMKTEKNPYSIVTFIDTKETLNRYIINAPLLSGTTLFVFRGPLVSAEAVRAHFNPVGAYEHPSEDLEMMNIHTQKIFKMMRLIKT